MKIVSIRKNVFKHMININNTRKVTNNLSVKNAITFLVYQIINKYLILILVGERTITRSIAVAEQASFQNVSQHKNQLTKSGCKV